MRAKILIVDDVPVQRRLLEAAVKRADHHTLLAESGVEALEILEKREHGSIDLMILDIVMPELDGMAVLERMRKMGLSIPVIVQTAQGGIDTAVSAMRAGAVDFAVKPVAPERLQVSIKNALKVYSLEHTITRLRKAQEGTLRFDDLITASPAMERVIDLGKRAAASNIPILIEGESGVGKELVARAIQGSSERSARSFITVNCGAIPENLVESILFGHEKGAFTGAVERRTGKFVEADGGTLFLDEVGELPLDMQVKLLRAIQEGEVDPVGGMKPVKTYFSLISATNRDMMQRVKDGLFREDLYYRLNVFPIRIPPLRERKEDVPDLAHHFAMRFAAEEGKKIDGISPAALRMLEGYDWPGNVRQLENAVFRAVVLCDTNELSTHEFPQIASYTGLEVDARLSQPRTPQATERGNEDTFSISLLDDDGQISAFTTIEEKVIREAIAFYKGNLSEVSRRLQIGRSTLYRKIKELGLEESA